MKSFLHYRLVIFAALITCGVFTGSCRAETDIPCPLLSWTIHFNSGDNICFSKESVPVCTEICHPVNSRDVVVDFIGFKKGEQFGKKTERAKSVSLPG